MNSGTFRQFICFITVIGEQCCVLSRLHIDIWDANFDDSINELICNKRKMGNDEDIKKQASLNDSVIPYFRSLQDIKIKCESYVEYLPPELLYYIFDCDGKLSIVQVM